MGVGGWREGRDPEALHTLTQKNYCKISYTPLSPE